MALTVEGTGEIHNRFPFAVFKVNILCEHSRSARILCIKIGMCAVAVYKSRKPEKIAGVLDLIYAVFQFGGFILAANCAESVYKVMLQRISQRNICIKEIAAAVTVIYRAVGVIRDRRAV